MDGEMILNDSGLMVEKWYRELENKYPDKKCHEMIIMPNHFHCIIENVAVGSDLRVCPNNSGHSTISDGTSISDDTSKLDVSSNLGGHIGSPLHRVMQWFKTMTTNEYIRGVKQFDWTRFNGKLWQRDYWEHIIRDEPSYQRISQYIINNPKNWDRDKLNGK